MAKKTSNPKTQAPVSAPSKRAVKTAAKKTVAQVQKATEAPPKKPLVYRRSLFAKILPYALVALALILAVCYVTVWALDMGDDGAGVVGYAIQALFCGLFGGLPAFVLAAVFAYVGVLWCVFHVQWKENDVNESRVGDGFGIYKKDRKRVIFKTVLAFVSVFLLTAIIAALFEPELDAKGSFTNGTESVWSGGVLGDFVAYFLVEWFQVVITEIILILLLTLSVLLMVGLTPDRIVEKVRLRREARREQKALAREQWEAEQAALSAAVPKKKIAAPAQTEDAPVAAPKKRARQGMTVDEIMEEPVGQAPTPTDEDAPYHDPEPQIVINIPPEPKEEEPAPEAPSTGEDFGGDPAFDANEYRSIDSILAEMKGKTAQASATATATAEAEPEEEDPIPMGEIGSEELLSDVADVMPEEGEVEDTYEVEIPYLFPSIELLEKNRDTAKVDYTEEMNKNAKILVDTLRSFRVGVQAITCSRGPTITRYEIKPEVGTRVRSIANLVDDIALNLATSGVRIEAPIPGKAAVGIEVPNETRNTVYLRELLEDGKFTEAKSRLTAALGKDVGGNPIYFDIAKMPHLLIAGATGMGKSVCINCLIVSLLYKAKPSELKLILIDPKKVEFAIYKEIPHLYAPIVSEPKKAAGALASAVAEMERRFELIEQAGVRDIGTYNASIENDPDKERMPHMVIIIDELADLMMTAPDEVESSICRLAQKARAAGIHLVIGTQRPSVDVITGLIKANIPSRCACTVASQIDSRTIIDIAGAEKLIGRGDMLFAPVGCAKPLRVQGAFVSEAEVEKIVSFIRDNNAKAKYNKDFISRLEEEAAKCGAGKKGAGGGGSAEITLDADVEGGDEKFRDAVKLAVEEGKISTSLMQRRLGVGYGRAAKIIDTMEQLGYVSKPDGNKPRRVLLTQEEFLRRVTEGTLGGVEE